MWRTLRAWPDLATDVLLAVAVFCAVGSLMTNPDMPQPLVTVAVFVLVPWQGYRLIVAVDTMWDTYRRGGGETEGR